MKKNFVSKLMLLFCCFLMLQGCEEKKMPDQAQRVPLTGQWQGFVKADGRNMAVNIRFFIDGELKGLLSMPDQKEGFVPLSNIKYLYPNISFQVNSKPNMARFEGKLQNNILKGDFNQGGAKGPFELTYYVPPKPYKTEEMILKTETGDLYGSLMLPKAEGQFPIVLIIPGSGPTDRDGNSAVLPGKNYSLRMMAEALAVSRIASLRIDKRGVAKSALAITDESGLTFDTYIDDAVQWLDKLKLDKRFFAVGVIGHSEGSLVGLMAAKKAIADFYISIAGTGRSADEILREQLLGQVGGLIEADIKKKLQDEFAEKLTGDLSDRQMAQYKEELKQRMDEEFTKSQAGNEARQLQDEIDSIITSLKKGESAAVFNETLMQFFRPSIQPYMISWFKYDPVKELKNTQIPALILHGTADLQVPLLDAKLLASARDDLKFIPIENMNHVLKKATTEDKAANMKTYSDPTLPLVPELVEELRLFIYTIMSMMY